NMGKTKISVQPFQLPRLLIIPITIGIALAALFSLNPFFSGTLSANAFSPFFFGVVFGNNLIMHDIHSVR
ncbi:hypothetical protein, partial [Staphylococcus haemolyticus]|uniref:hypothetical protein n=1 Tax=Staphylococcus haemolyticus TaxID=1283 RepID=UPI0015D98622